MKHYTNTGTLRTIQRCKDLNVGLLIVSPKWRDPDRWPYYAIDNGAYADWRAGRTFDGHAFTRVIDRALAHERRPDFVVLPDIVAGGLDSLALSLHWLDRLPSELRYYLAIQDGMTAEDVVPHLDRVEGLAGGGSWDRPGRYRMDTAPVCRKRRFAITFESNKKVIAAGDVE